MPPRIGVVYDALWQQVANLNLLWGHYRGLFIDGGEEAGKLMSRFAASFFLSYRGVLWHSLVLRLRRLVDPPGVGERENATLTWLVREIRARGEEDLQLRVLRGVEQLDAATEDMKLHRHKLIAHLDLQVVEGRLGLPQLSYEKADEAIRVANKIVDEVHRHYLDAECRMSEIIETGGADGLLEALRMARRWRDHQKAQLRATVRRDT